MPRRGGMTITPADVARIRFIHPIPIQKQRPGEFHYAKMYLHPSAFLPFPGLHGAQRVFLKRIGRPPFDDRHSKRDHAYNLQDAKKEIQIRASLKAAGLPVPHTGIFEVKSGKNAGVYLVMPPFLRKGGKESILHAINPGGPLSGRPYFLCRLTVEKDAALIRALARETAAMCNSGISSPWFDHYGFYKRKDGSWGHIVMDTGELHRISQRNILGSAQNMLTIIREALGGGSDRITASAVGAYHPVYQLFKETFWKHADPIWAPKHES